MASTSGCKLSASPVLFVLNVALILLLITAKSASASQERTKTEEFNVRPGGVVHSFSQKMGEYSCSFTYASQGGTNEQWQMSVGLSEDDRLFSCSVWRPQGKSYLFFTQFKAEVTGAKIEYGSAFSQAAVGGNKDVALKAEEYTVGESTVTHNEGKFRAELSKLTIIANAPRRALIGLKLQGGGSARICLGQCDGFDESPCE